jgi:hypothetical protein
MAALEQVLGLVFLAAYITGVVGLAAGITWAIVKIFPTERGDDKKDNEKKQSSTNDAVPGGRLFRKSKRSAT